MHEIAVATVGPVITTDGAFRTVSEVPFRAGGALVSLIHWAVDKKRSGLPFYPYLVLTNEELMLLEFRFGAEAKLKRVVGRWPLRAVRIIETSPEQWRLTLVLPSGRRPVKLEGLFRSAAEKAVLWVLKEVASGL